MEQTSSNIANEQIETSRKLNDQEQIRMNKVDEIKSLGIDPFGVK